MIIDIVLNKCYGGFSLSPFAMKSLLDSKSTLIVRKVIDEATFNDFKKFAKPYDGFWVPYSSCIIRRENSEYVSYELNDSDEFIFRTHPDLVNLLRKHGSKLVSGECAKLEIVEKYIDLGIDCHDGYETLD